MVRTFTETVVLPLASPRDAEATGRAVRPYLEGTSDHVLVVHVIEKAGGAPDKVSVEQARTRADEIFATVEAAFADSDVPVETRVVYDTDVARAILTVAEDADATSIVVTPRGAGRWMKMLSGQVMPSLVDDTDRPVIVIPERETEDG